MSATTTAAPAAPDRDARSVGRLASRGGLTLILRQALGFALSTVGGILLARLLTPADFGAYAYLIVAQSLAGLLANGGLPATLVRQPEEPDREDWSSVFTLQCGLALLLAVALVASTPLAAAVFGDVPGFAAANLLAALSVVVAPAVSVCFARLERALRFDRLGMLAILQPLVFNVVAPLLAAAGLGVVALGAGLLIGNVAVLVVALAATGALPAIVLRPRGLRARIRFGLPFVGSGLISTLKEAVNPLLVGVVVGAAAVGYVRWSQQVAVLSTYLVAAVSPMLFAVFSRLQQDPGRLSTALSAAIFWSNAVTAPLAVLLVVFIRPITSGLYGEQWLPAIGLFYLLCLANLIAPTTSVLIALMNAIGRPGTAFAFTAAWFAGTWVLVPVFLLPLGTIGYGVANAAVQVIGIALVVIARRRVPFSFAGTVLKPWGIGVLAALPAIAAVGLLHADSLPVAVVAGAGCLIVFGGLLLVLARREARLLVSKLGRGTA